MLKILMICPSSSQPRIIKRAQTLSNLSSLKIMGFRRRVYEENKFPDNINYTSLGYVSDGKYLRRIFTLFKALLLVRKKVTQDSIYYAMSIDCLILARLSGIKRGFYEIGDLRSCEKPQSLIAKLERLLISMTGGVVITSKYFYSEYFEKFSNTRNSNFCVIENKLTFNLVSGIRPQKRPVVRGKIRIGLVGLLRYEKPIRWLINFINSNNKLYELHCYGDGPLVDFIRHNCNEVIKYYGSFKASHDLTEIYQNIDINFVVYDSRSKNVQLALPNKLYESIFFAVPILVAKTTALQEEVEKLQIGIGISLSSEKQFSDDIRKISSKKIEDYSRFASRININQLCDDSKENLQSLLKVYEC